jgi:hypothetical protein
MMAINEQSVFDYSPRWQPKPRKKNKKIKNDTRVKERAVNVKLLLFEVLLRCCLTPGSCWFCHAIIHFSFSCCVLFTSGTTRV